MFSDRYLAKITKTADQRTIMNYRTHGQTRKTIIDYHEEFEQAQTENYRSLRGYKST